MIPTHSTRRRRLASGASAIELLLAVPIILLLGMGVVQYALVYQARHALDYALIQAARQGAVDHASSESIARGLAAGLVPYLYGADDWASLREAEVRAAAHLVEGSAAGWVRLVQRSPRSESFDDWAVPALDPFGETIAGVQEIPNDNLDNRRLTMQPVSGVAGDAAGEPVGRVSGQSLADANLLRLELTYGVRLAVPVVGPIVLAMLAAWDGCGEGATGPAERTLGLVRLEGASAQDGADGGACAFYGAVDGQGRAAGRIPVVLSATVRMMSTARRSALTQARVDQGSGVAFGGSGSGGPVGDARPGDPGEPSGPGGPDAAPGRGGSGSGGSPGSPFGNGFLRIGADRPYSDPGRHPALCGTG